MPRPSDSDTGALDEVLLRVGRLNYTWTNTESLFIHVMAGLAGMDKETAVVVFLTLNTTAARLDLVDRLSKLPRVPDEERRAVTALTQRFRKESRLRNKYNHCIYSFDPEGRTPLTIMMRIADRKDEIIMGKQEPAGEDQLSQIDETIGRLKQLNLDIWAVIRAQGYPL
jgi:hypothetical protein